MKNKWILRLLAMALAWAVLMPMLSYAEVVSEPAVEMEESAEQQEAEAEAVFEDMPSLEAADAAFEETQAEETIAPADETVLAEEDVELPEQVDAQTEEVTSEAAEEPAEEIEVQSEEGDPEVAEASSEEVEVLEEVELEAPEGEEPLVAEAETAVEESAEVTPAPTATPAPTTTAGAVEIQSNGLPTKKTLGVKETFTLDAKSVLKGKGKITFKTSNKKVASVSTTGKIKGLKVGTAIITATKGKKKITCKVTVKKAPGKVTLDAKNITVGTNFKWYLTAKLPKNTASKLTWSSSNKSIATVSKSGVVTGKKPGTATITVKTFNGKKATCRVKVVRCRLSFAGCTEDFEDTFSWMAQDLTYYLEHDSEVEVITDDESNDWLYAWQEEDDGVTVSMTENLTGEERYGCVVVFCPEHGSAVVLNVCQERYPCGMTLGDGDEEQYVWIEDGTTGIGCPFIPDGSWSAFSDVDWFSWDYYEDEGMLSLIFDPNYTDEERTGTLTLFCEDHGEERRLIVTQAPTVPCMLSVKGHSEDFRVTLRALKGGYFFRVDCEHTYSVESDVDWITINGIEREYNGEYGLGFDAETNTSTQPREGTVRVWCDGHGTEIVMTIKQQAAEAASVSVSKITLNKTALELQTGKSETLAATVTPSNATNKELSWTSSNTAVAKVAAGKVTAVKAGTATITAAAQDGSGVKATCVVTVKGTAIDISSVTMSETTLSLTVGKTANLVANPYPLGASIASTSWKSSNTAVATVNEGKITAVKAGTATITATLKSTLGTTKTGTCKVTVTNAAPTFTVKHTTETLIAQGRTTGSATMDSGAGNGAKYTLTISSSAAWTVSASDTTWLTLPTKTSYAAGNNTEYVLTLKGIVAGRTYTSKLTFTVDGATYTLTVKLVKPEVTLGKPEYVQIDICDFAYPELRSTVQDGTIHDQTNYPLDAGQTIPIPYSTGKNVLRVTYTVSVQNSAGVWQQYGSLRATKDFTDGTVGHTGTFNMALPEDMPSGIYLLRVYAKNVAGDGGDYVTVKANIRVKGQKILEDNPEMPTNMKYPGTLFWPTVSKSYSPVGERNRVKLTNGGYSSRYHHGMDIGGTVGDNVYATADGIAVRVAEIGGYGKCVIIDHQNGYYSLYGHMSAFNVTVGARVNRGDIIGKVGQTGGVTGPHLHFELAYCVKGKGYASEYLMGDTVYVVGDWAILNGVPTGESPKTNKGITIRGIQDYINYK